MKRLIIMGLLIILPFLVLGQKCEAVEYSEVVVSQLMVEQALEERVQSVLTKILGPNRARIVIVVEPNVERSMTEIETWAEQKSKEEEGKGKLKERKDVRPPKVKELLPGIPLKKSVLEREEEVAPTSEAKKEATGMKKRVESIVKLPPSFVKRITATLIIDRKVSDTLVETVKSVVSDLLNLEPKRGDELIIMRVSFIPAAPWWSILFKPQTYWVIIGMLLTITLLMFLFGPLKTFFQNLLNTMKELKASRTEIEAATSTATGGGGGPGLVTVEEGLSQKMEGTAVEGEEEEIPQTFRFVKESNLKRLLYLIKNEPPEAMALILSYLTPDQAAKVFSSLSPELQSQVALNLATVKQMDEEIVNRIGSNIREKINLLKGGVDEFVEIFDRLDKKSKENILNTMEKKNPELVKKIRDLTFSFEQITTIDNPTLRIILGEINTADLAVALRGEASEEVKSKIMENMSAGGAVLLKEEMEFGKPVTSQAIEQQQQKIVDLILRLEREGKIELKGRKRRGEIEKIEELQDIKKIVEEEIIRKRLREEPEEVVQATKKSKESEKTDNEKAFEHYNAGIEASQAGRYEEAVREFKKSLQYNDRIWQTYQYLGSCYYNQGMEEEAVQAYKKALELNPDNRELSEWLKNRK